MGDVAVAPEREPLMERLRRSVLFGLEARERRPRDRKDPEQCDDPGERGDAVSDRTALPDAQPRAAPHARCSSLKRLESTRSANVAMMIEKMTTTIAYADADPYRKPPPIDSW